LSKNTLEELDDQPMVNRRVPLAKRLQPLLADALVKISPPTVIASPVGACGSSSAGRE